MSFNIDLTNKIFDMAVHLKTPKNEARTAAMMFCNSIAGANLASQNISFHKTWFLGAPAEPLCDLRQRELSDQIRALKQQRDNEDNRNREVLKHIKINELSLRQRVKTLEAERQRLQAQCDRLTAKTGISNEPSQSPEDVVSGDMRREYISFRSLAAKAERIFGHRRWKPALAAALGMSMKELNGWQNANAFPAHMAKRLDEFTIDQLKSASRQPWTVDEIERLKVLLETGASDLDTAQTLSAEFGRRIYEPSVTRQRRRLFRIEGWKPVLKARRSVVTPQARQASPRPSRSRASQIRESALVAGCGPRAQATS